MSETAVNRSAKKTGASSRFSAKYIAFVGIFGAISAVLMILEFPLPFAPPFYKLDFSEVPVLISSFSLGPIAGMLTELIKVVLHVLFKGSSTAGVGDVANFMVGCFFVVPAGIIYLQRKTKKNAIIGMAVGTVLMVAAGCLVNAFILLPTYARVFNMPIDTLVGMGTAVNSNVNSIFTFVMLCVAPFNLVKGVAVSVITFFLYKRVSGFIHHAAE